MIQSPMDLDLPIYHETLASALQTAELYAIGKKAIISRPALREEFATGGVPYGTTREGHVEIEFLKGKKTKKHFHVSIYRMDSGRYELTCYIL